MRTHAELVIIGAGIVGCSAARYLAERGVRDVVVIEQGLLFAAGGSTSHAPGLVFQTNVSQTMCQLAQTSVAAYSALELEGQPCFHGVGSLEVAATFERWQDLKWRRDYAASWGVRGELVTPAEAHDMLPLLDPSQIFGAYYVANDGIAKAVRAAEAMARRAQAHGIDFHGGVELTGIEVGEGRVRAVTTSQGRIETERVLVCAGIWGPRVGRMAGVPIPLTPVQHQYVRTAPLTMLAGEIDEVVHPILRHQDKRMYFRQHANSYGIGSYAHAPILTSADQIRRHADSPVMPSVVPFTPEDFAEPWRDAGTLLPPLRNAEIANAFNGMFSFTPDGMPLIGESPDVRGFWVAEAVWVTHGAGVGAQVAEWMIEGATSIDLRECNLNRFDRFAYSPAYVRARGAQQYREVYDILHPLQQVEQPRPVRTSPFYLRQQALGAVFFEGGGWERAQWFERDQSSISNSESILSSEAATSSSDQSSPSNRLSPFSNAQADLSRNQVGLSKQRSAFNVQHSAFHPFRSGWAAQNWSSHTVEEHGATREQVALFDMTPLARCEIRGSGALEMLQELTTNNLDRPVGSITYTAMCNDRGGLLSDITVTRLGEQQFWVAHNGPNDLTYFRQHAPATVDIRDVTGATCCVGVWGPRARDLVQSLSDNDLSNAAFPYLFAQHIFVGEVPVLALRVSYVGELGWELYTSAEYGLRLWDMLWRAGQPHGIVAGGRGAFDSLRLEKGYRFYGRDMHSGNDPYEAGIGFTVKLNKGAFRGQAVLAERKAQGLKRKLCCVTLDDPTLVLLGKEPVYNGETCVGYVTSANYGPSVGQSIAYTYLPIELAQTGEKVQIAYFGERHGATVQTDPLFDPKGERLRG